MKKGRGTENKHESLTTFVVNYILENKKNLEEKGILNLSEIYKETFGIKSVRLDTFNYLTGTSLLSNFKNNMSTRHDFSIAVSNCKLIKKNKARERAVELLNFWFNTNGTAKYNLTKDSIGNLSVKCNLNIHGN